MTLRSITGALTHTPDGTTTKRGLHWKLEFTPDLRDDECMLYGSCVVFDHNSNYIVPDFYAFRLAAGYLCLDMYTAVSANLETHIYYTVTLAHT